MIVLFVLTKAYAQQDPANLVNPFIGTGGHGHTFPGATAPFGMVQLSPDTRIDGSWDGCSGYHYSDSLIYGFSHTHLSGTGVSDYGDIALLPVANATHDEVQRFDDYKKFAQGFNHQKENATPGYYAVEFRNGIKAELSATTRVGIHRYTFPKKSNPGLIIQIDHRDETIESELKIVNNKTIEGFRRSKAWAQDQHIYFRIEFSSPFNGKKETTAGKEKSRSAGMLITFPKLKGKKLVVKVAVSQVAVEGARKNMIAELPGWNFDAVHEATRNAWVHELNKIQIKGGTDEQQRIFYSALYHTMIHPNVAMDVDSLYRGRDLKIHKAENFTYYTVFSLWDTFRAVHPLYTIIDRKRSLDFIKTFLVQFEQGGRLPVWELSSNETDCMIGYHSVSVITDAAVKGIADFDMELAFKAMVKSAGWPHQGIPAYMDKGFLSAEDEHESVSKTLEYAYDDWCIARFAKMLGKKKFEEAFLRRAQSWKNLFDPETQLMRPRKNGAWLQAFDPKEVNNHFTEANSWQYSFFVPQDVFGLIEAHGGPDKFGDKLDQLFSDKSATTGRSQVDITGLIGQYAHGNEPSHHMAYLYNFAGQPQKAQDRLLQIMQDFYKNTPDGLIGNEDCGQMSAWYVFSAMGFYPLTPGIPHYSVGTPLFSEIKIRVDDDRYFTIKAEGISVKNKYVTSINGTKQYSISHAEIEQGRTVLFEMGEKPEQTFHSGGPFFVNDFAKTESIPVPYFSTGVETFRDSISIEIRSIEKGLDIHYTTDGSIPTHYSPKYFAPLNIKNTSIVKAICSRSGMLNSPVVSAEYHKIDHNWRVILNAQYNMQYAAGGPEALVDGLRGEQNWRKGRWMGFQAQDFNAVIDFGISREIKSVQTSFLEDTRSWIWLPVQVQYDYSDDGMNWKKMAQIETEKIAEGYSERIQIYHHALPKAVHCRYLRVRAINYGKLPVWHPGSGGDAFIFVDEIKIR